MSVPAATVTWVWHGVVKCRTKQRQTETCLGWGGARYAKASTARWWTRSAVWDRPNWMKG